jgi:hypothetical protein
MDDVDDVTLEIVDDVGYFPCYHIAWMDPEDGAGECLGEDQVDDGDEHDDDHSVATDAAQQHPMAGQDDRGYFWDSKKSVTIALRAARAAVKAFRIGKPLPEWAITALAHGWTQPKG